jgi:hypothetical protein
MSDLARACVSCISVVRFYLFYQKLIMNRFVSLSLFTKARPSYIITRQGVACLANSNGNLYSLIKIASYIYSYVIIYLVQATRTFATNISTEETVQMEESMNKIEELFATAKDEVRICLLLTLFV